MVLVAKDGAVVMTTSFQIGNPKSILLEGQFSSLLLWSFYSDRSSGIKLLFSFLE